MTVGFHIAGEPGHELGRALLAEGCEVQREGAFEEDVADVEKAELHDVGDEDVLEELEEPSEDDDAKHSPHQEHEGAESVGREIAVHEGVQVHVPIAPEPVALLLASEFIDSLFECVGAFAPKSIAGPVELVPARLVEACLLAEGAEVELDLEKFLFLGAVSAQGFDASFDVVDFREFLSQACSDVFEPFLKRSAASAVFGKGLLDELDLLDPGVRKCIILFDFGNLAAEPGAAVFAVEQHFKKREHGADVGAKEGGDHHRAGDRQQEPAAIGPSVAHQAREILHFGVRLGAAGLLAFPSASSGSGIVAAGF